MTGSEEFEAIGKRLHELLANQVDGAFVDRLAHDLRMLGGTVDAIASKQDKGDPAVWSAMREIRDGNNPAFAALRNEVGALSARLERFETRSKNAAIVVAEVIASLEKPATGRDAGTWQTRALHAADRLRSLVWNPSEQREVET